MALQTTTSLALHPQVVDRSAKDHTLGDWQRILAANNRIGNPMSLRVTSKIDLQRNTSKRLQLWILMLSCLDKMAYWHRRIL